MKIISNVREQYKKREKLASAQLENSAKVVLNQEAVHYCLAHGDPNGYGDWSLWDKRKSETGKKIS